MSELEPAGDPVAEAFAGFADAAAPYVRPVGMAAVRATVRRRRTTRLAIGAVTAVLAVVGPLAWFAQGGQEHQPVPGESVSPSPAPSSPAPIPTGSPSGTTSSSAVSGGPTSINATTISCSAGNAGSGFTPSSLCDATVVMPTGSCVNHGSLTFKRGTAAGVPANQSGPLAIVLQKAVQVDVDHDGNPDVVALIACQFGDPATPNVIAFTRDSAGIHTLGIVVAPTGTNGVGGVDDLGADSAGAVRVRVDNQLGSTGNLRAVHQWRTYSWTGTAFAQTAGHTSFIADRSATKLDLTVGKITVDPARNGTQRVWLSATVHNKGTATATDLSVYGLLDGDPDPNGCPKVTGDSVNGLVESCAIPSLAPGRTRTVTLSFIAVAGDVSPPNRNGDDFAQLRLGDQEYTYDGNLQAA